MASEPQILTGREVLAPGVFGYTVDTADGLYIPWIAAEKEGNGDVGRYLDSLPTDRRVVFPTILSRRLAEMLIRRGFRYGTEWSEEAGETIEFLDRGPA